MYRNIHRSADVVAGCVHAAQRPFNMCVYTYPYALVAPVIDQAVSKPLLQPLDSLCGLKL